MGERVERELLCKQELKITQRLQQMMHEIHCQECDAQNLLLLNI